MFEVGGTSLSIDYVDQTLDGAESIHSHRSFSFRDSNSSHELSQKHEFWVENELENLNSKLLLSKISNMGSFENSSTSWLPNDHSLHGD